MDLNRTHGGDIYSLAELKKVPPESVLDFSASINPLGPPEGIIENLNSSLFDIVNYPEIKGSKLLNKISETYKISKNEIIAANGSTELLYLLPMALKAKSILTLSPSFAEYSALVKQLGINEYSLKLSSPFKPLAEDIISFLKQNDPIDIVYLCNPGNPSGQVMGANEILKLLSYIKDGYLVVDEAFIDFCPEFTMIQHNSPNLIILRSFTKFFSIPGMRLGFMKADKKIIEKLKGWQPPWSVNSVAAGAGILSLDSHEFIDKSIQFMKKESDYLYAELAKNPLLSPLSTMCNFILVKLDGHDISSLCSLLEDDLILIRNCASFGLPEYFRVAVKSREENNLLLEKITFAEKLMNYPG